MCRGGPLQGWLGLSTSPEAPWLWACYITGIDDDIIAYSSLFIFSFLQCVPFWPINITKAMQMVVKVKDMDLETLPFSISDDHTTLLPLAHDVCVFFALHSVLLGLRQCYCFLTYDVPHMLYS